MQVVVVTGMSGSGKSTVMDVMEDIGYYCIDNLPPQLIHRFVEICRESENKLEKIAIAADLRSGEMFADAYDCVCRLKEQSDLHVKLLYIEAQDEVIIKRYKETRRKHPLDERFNGCLHQALEFEREQLLRLKAIADYYIETSYISVSQLKEQIRETFLETPSDSLSIKVTSFGFKYGVSTESDLVFDVRCLPNPYYIPELKALTGLDEPVRNFIFQYQQTKDFLEKTEDLLAFLLPNYVDEGKTDLVIAVGCTGGQHRSSCIAKELCDFISKRGYVANLTHRDMSRNRG